MIRTYSQIIFVAYSHNLKTSSITLNFAFKSHSLRTSSIELNIAYGYVLHELNIFTSRRSYIINKKAITL